MRRSTESPRAFMRSLSRMKDWTLTERGHSAAILDDQLSWRDRALYVWLSEIGLTPAKSLSLGPLAVPDQYFADFFRGCIELIAPCSCTSIVITFRSQSVASTSVCTCLLCRRATDSFEWLRTTVERLTHANGSIEMRERQGGHALWRLRYAKAESIQRLRWMYYASNVPCLERRKQRRRSLSPLGHAPLRHTGRPRTGGYTMETQSIEHRRTHHAGVE